MTGKTHLSVGLAITMFVTQPKTIGELVLCIGVASIGSVISDVDVSTSDSHEKLDRILALAVITSIIIAFIEYKWNVGIVKLFMNNSNAIRLFIGMTAFLGICAFGKTRPHRSFMHSFLAVALLSASVYILLPLAVPYFAIAMMSHMTIDTLNRKKVLLIYPIPLGVSFGLCHAKGLVNNMIFKVATIVAFVEFILLFAQIVT